MLLPALLLLLAAPTAGVASARRNGACVCS